MNYKDEMRKLIDIVKQQSFNAPLEQTLDDMNILTTAVSDLSDRINIRVNKSLQPKDKDASKVVKGKTTKRNVKAFPSISPKPLPTPKSQNLPNPNSVTSTSATQSDYDRLKQNKVSVASIKPQAPI